VLTACAEQFAIGVADPWHRFLNIAANHSHRLGPDTLKVLQSADVIVFLEADVPWMDAHGSPRPETFIAQVGVDPLYSDYPIRSHHSDLNIAATPTAFLTQLSAALAERAGRIDGTRAERIRTAARTHHDAIAAIRVQETADSDEPITKNAISAVLGELLGEDDIVFNEYIATPCLLNRTKPGTYYFLPASGGLGWGLPAALGAQYAAPGRTVVATLGDGAYMFANPAACHHAAAKHKLPVLTIIANNTNWWAVDLATQLVYPDGRANAEDRFSNLAPSPDFAAYCTASGGHGVTVHQRGELKAALVEALRVVREEGRQALVDVRCV
jgi:acetolactate synthase-1/2/3 large subunit